jgi:hypothetical protein
MEALPITRATTLLIAGAEPDPPTGEADHRRLAGGALEPLSIAAVRGQHDLRLDPSGQPAKRLSSLSISPADMVLTRTIRQRPRVLAESDKSIFSVVYGGRYWDRTSDPYDVNVVLYR